MSVRNTLKNRQLAFRLVEFIAGTRLDSDLEDCMEELVANGFTENELENVRDKSLRNMFDLLNPAKVRKEEEEDDFPPVTLSEEKNYKYFMEYHGPNGYTHRICPEVSREEFLTEWRIFRQERPCVCDYMDCREREAMRERILHKRNHASCPQDKMTEKKILENTLFHYWVYSIRYDGKAVAFHYESGVGNHYDHSIFMVREENVPLVHEFARVKHPRLTSKMVPLSTLPKDQRKNMIASCCIPSKKRQEQTGMKPYVIEYTDTKTGDTGLHDCYFLQYFHSDGTHYDDFVEEIQKQKDEEVRESLMVN